ncbi:MAG: RNA repair domain-containing protein [Candidatus Bathyarchaeia archaeon]
MHPLKNVFNRILWDRRVKGGDYSITFIHRGAPHDEKTIVASSLRNVGRSWFTYDDHGEEILIPMHRIVKVENLKTGDVLWRKRFPIPPNRSRKLG